MAYTEPNVLIHQILEPATVATPREQPAVIMAPYAHLGRYSDSDEKPDILIGYYDDGQETCVSWPGIPAGAKPDAGYTKLFVDDALLRYFTSSLNLVAVEDGLSRVRSSTLAFKANGDSYPLSDEFNDRDVKVGDIARVRAVVDSVEYVLWSYVAGLEADTVAASIGSATIDEDNTATQVNPAVSYSKTAGDSNCVDITAADDSAYAGAVDGDVNETYRIRVVEASVDGDATTARLYVTSASGNDDQGEISPAAFGAATDIGTRGLTVTWDLAEDGCSSSAEDDGIAPNDFVVGQEWEVTCGEAFTRPTIASGGAYTGEVSTTLVVQVTRGGSVSSGDPPQITCTTISGGDYSGPTDVTAFGSGVAVGSNGVTITFSGGNGKLCRDDIYYIEVTAERPGHYRTIRLGNNLAQEVIDNGETAVSLSLYMRRDIQVPENREDDAPNVNWSQTDDEFCVKAGMTATDPEWSSGGELIPMEVFSSETLGYGRMYLEYRAWLSDFCDNVFTLETIGEIDDVIPGPLSPDNPLKYGVYWAKALSQGVAVRFIGVCDPDDVDSWTGALDYMENRRDVYGVVPVTRNAEILLAVYGHVTEQSSAQIGCRRAVWISQSIPDSAVVSSAASSSDGEDILATVADDPDVSGTQYTLLQVSGTNSRFVTDGVRAGDVVRLLYTTDGFGVESYTEAVVDEVVNQQTIKLSTGLDAAVNVARKIEVWRNLNNEDKTDALIAAKSFDDRRAMVVLPDEFTIGTTAIDGLYMTCALAGLASGVEPHQPLTRYAINGVTGVPKMSAFKRSQLNRLADAGFWLVVEDKQSGTVWTRHALTSATRDDANYREEVVTRNLDNISLQTYDILVPFLGVSNNVPNTRNYMQAAIDGRYRRLRSEVTNPLLGAQMTDLTELTVEPHTILKNNVVITTRMELPYAINEVDDYMII